MQLEVLAEKGRHGEQRAMAGPLAQTLSNTAQGFESVCMQRVTHNLRYQPLPLPQ